MQVEFDVVMPMRDGTVLVADVQRPAGPGRFPTLLQRVPYDRGAPAIRDGALDTVRAVRRGYAVVTQDCRGRFDSDGDFVPFVREADDGVDTIGWIREQPWSDGRVGMFGRSYSAFLQWQTAALNPEGLLAIAPMFSGAEPARDWFGGPASFEWGFAVMWGLRHLASDALRRKGHDAVPAAARIAAGIDAVLAEGGHRDDLTEVLQALPWLADWYDDARRPAALDLLAGACRPASEVTIPALTIAGWFDLFLPGTLAAAGSAAGERSLVVGPWPHGGANPGVFPELSFGPAASGDAVGLTDRQLAWFDRWLRDAPPTTEPDEATWFHCGVGWRSSDRWPPADAGTHVLRLDEAGRLVESIPPHGERTLAYDESRPVPTLGGPTFLPGLEVAGNAGPRDQRPILVRNDVLAWTGDPLSEALDVVGDVSCLLEVDAAPGSRVVARLVEHGADGRAMLVTDGATTTTDDGRAEVSLNPTAWRFPAGSSIGLLVSCTSSPRFRRSVTGEGSPSARVGSWTVRTGPHSVLRLGGSAP